MGRLGLSTCPGVQVVPCPWVRVQLGRGRLGLQQACRGRWPLALVRRLGGWAAAYPECVFLEARRRGVGRLGSGLYISTVSVQVGRRRFGFGAWSRKAGLGLALGAESGRAGLGLALGMGSRRAGLGLALGVWYGKASSGVVIGTGSLRAGGVLVLGGVCERRPHLGPPLGLLRAAGGLPCS